MWPDFTYQGPVKKAFYLSDKTICMNEKKILEACYFDRINMTENWLKYDQTISKWRTLLFENDRKMFSMTNIIFLI